MHTTAPITAIGSDQVLPVAAAPSVVAATEAPEQIRSDSVEIANSYGFAPVIALATPAVIYHVTSSHGTVTPVAPVVRINAFQERPLGSNLDRYA